MCGKSLIIWYAVLLHWVWGCMLLSHSSPLNITAIWAVSKFGLVSPSSAAILYFLVSGLAMIGLMAPKASAIWFFIPQQIVLTLSAYSATLAMIHGQFADGVVRSTQFLIADQSPAVIAAVLYFLAIVCSSRD